MKNNLLILLAGMLLCGSLSAQDLIFIKPHNSTIEAKVIEITEDEIKYRNFDQLDGPIRTIDKSEVNKIVYEDGTEEEFKGAEKSYNYDQYLNNQDTLQQPAGYKHGKYFLIGAGFGNSYGGIGVKFAGRFGDIVGFGFHGGFGYLPSFTVDSGNQFEDISTDGAFLYSAGFQFFFYKWLYADLQYGSFGIESFSRQECFFNDFDFTCFSESGTEILYGPSFLIGGDFIFGKRFGFNGALGVSYNINDSILLDSEIYIALDLGFIVAF